MVFPLTPCQVILKDLSLHGARLATGLLASDGDNIRLYLNWENPNKLMILSGKVVRYADLASGTRELVMLSVARFLANRARLTRCGQGSPP